MTTEGPGPEERPEDSGDIDARFDEIVAGLRAEQAESAARRRAAIRRAQTERREQRGQENRPLQGFDDPNPWPPRPTDHPTSPSPGAPGGDSPTSSDAPRGASPSPGPSRSDYPDPDALPGDDPTSADSDPQAAWRGWEESDDEEHFIPPTPPLPAGDLHLWAIVAGLLGGPLLLILSEVFHVLDGGIWTPLGFVLSISGVVLLVLRLPKNRDWTDPSGGAQV